MWEHNGPLLLGRILQEWCQMEDYPAMDYIRCKGFNVLQETVFCPVYYTEMKELFEERSPTDGDQLPWLPNDTIGIHVWNKMSSDQVVYKQSTQYYSRMARNYCPVTYSIAPSTF